VNGAREIKVELLDGRKLSADLVSSDADADSLSINTSTWPL